MFNTLQKMRSKKGFTLMELLIVIAIIVILVAIMIPVMSGQTQKARDAADLANARSATSVISAYALLNTVDVSGWDVASFDDDAAWDTWVDTNIVSITADANQHIEAYDVTDIVAQLKDINWYSIDNLVITNGVVTCAAA